MFRKRRKIHAPGTLSLNSLEIKRTPDGLENEFVTIITITTLLITASLSLASAAELLFVWHAVGMASGGGPRFARSLGLNF